MCDPTGAQKSALSTDQALGAQLRSSYTTDFGESQELFNNLNTNLEGIVAAGPSQTGMAPADEAALRSQALNQAAASNQQVQQAIGEKNVMSSASPGVESGVTAAIQAKAATDIENNLANQQEGITEKSYDIGRQNYENAIKGEEALPGVLEAPNGAANAALSADSQTSNQANENAAASKSWMGMLGGLASAGVNALTTKLTAPRAPAGQDASTPIA